VEDHLRLDPSAMRAGLGLWKRYRICGRLRLGIGSGPRLRLRRTAGSLARTRAA